MYTHIWVSVDYNKSEKSLTPNIMNKNTIHMFRLFVILGSYVLDTLYTDAELWSQMTSQLNMCSHFCVIHCL